MCAHALCMQDVFLSTTSIVGNGCDHRLSDFRGERQLRGHGGYPLFTATALKNLVERNEYSSRVDEVSLSVFLFSLLRAEAAAIVVRSLVEAARVNAESFRAMIKICRKIFSPRDVRDALSCAFRISNSNAFTGSRE